MQNRNWFEKVFKFGDLRMQLPLAILCFALGVLLVTQFRTQIRITKSIAPLSSADQVAMISGLVESNSQLRKEVDQLASELTQYRNDSSQGTSNMDALSVETERMRILNGLVETTGPGVRIVVNASVKAVEIQDLINELRNSGAEGISLNGQRIVGRSSVINGPSNNCIVDGSELTAPYVLEVIGDPETLKTALERKGGMISLINYNYGDLSARVNPAESLTLPKYTGVYDFAHAEPVKQQ